MSPISLGQENLLVGQNATGKSTISQSLFHLARMLKGSPGKRLGRYEIELTNSSGSKYIYECSILYDSQLQIFERLSKDGVLLIQRDESSAQMYSEAEQKLILINPPPDRLISEARRDEKEYPYLEELINWAAGVHYFKFGHVHAQPANIFIDGNSQITSLDDKDLNKILGQLDIPTKESVIQDFNSLGYSLELINIKKNGDQNIIYVRENGFKYEIHQILLSQGMFRSLFLLIFIQHLINKERSSLVIIDDLCEGLDYQRATKLGKLLFEKLSNSNIQSLATSNDYFLMNVVDVKFWNIIYRRGRELAIKNYSNSEKEFDRFRRMGLNNFDLFSSDFLNS
jgi:hypothetical protein